MRNDPHYAPKQKDIAMNYMPEFFGGEAATIHDIQPLENPVNEIKRSLPALRNELDRIAELAETAMNTAQTPRIRFDEGVPVTNLYDSMRDLKTGIEDFIDDVINEVEADMGW